MNITLFDLNARQKGNFLSFDCPCGKETCGGRIRLPLSPEPKGWNVQGEFPTITLTPSVLVHPTGEPKGSYCAGWHGYIRAGVMEPC